jgi:DNA-binding NarL/FixJ family response regulator
MLLKLESDIDIIGLAEDGARALDLIIQQEPDLVLMDLKMPIMNGVEAIHQIRIQHPLVKILVLTTYDDDDWVFNAVQAGASGYLLKDAPRDDLIKAIRGTVAGKTYVDPSVAGKILRQATSHQTQSPTAIIGKLTDREVDVLRMLARGLNNKDISERLFLSEGTVRNHVSSILAKLNVTDRTQAAVIAIQHGLGDQ